MASRFLSDLAPPVLAAANAMLASAKKGNFKILIYCTLRSHEEQDDLFAIGRTVQIGRPKLTYAKAGESNHNPDKFGKAWAFDAVPLDAKGVPLWGNAAKIKTMGGYGKNAGLDWGGDWKNFTDSFHFELQGKNYD